MTQHTQHHIASIAFQAHKPTQVSAVDLFQWVIWQFPTLKEGGFCAAVHPPLPDHTWYPAIVRNEGQQIQVFAHLNTHFNSPEEAVNYLCQPKSS